MLTELLRSSYFTLPLSNFSANEICSASDIADDKKRKNVEPEDIIKSLSNNGFEGYVDVFKKGLDESKTFASLVRG